MECVDIVPQSECGTSKHSKRSHDQKKAESHTTTGTTS